MPGPPATTLAEAAGRTADQLNTISLIPGALRQRFGFFTDIRFSFRESAVNEHSVLNWVALMGQLQPLITVSHIPLTTTALAIQYVYRTCWNTQSLLDASLITTAQADAVLDRWNFSFNFP